MNPAENYILNQVEPYRSILLHLQIVVEINVPDLELKYRYNIPFYYLEDRPFCYLNQSKDYVDLGFRNAVHLKVNLEFMTTAQRKMIKFLRYRNLKEIDDKILVEILKDAYSVKGEKFWK